MPNKETRTAAVMKQEMDTIEQTLLDNLRTPPEIIQAKRDFLTARPIRRIYACACGDSLYAIEAAAYAFRRFSGIEFEAVESHEFCRYGMDFAPKDALILPVSNNGNAARTNECCFQAQRRGYTVLTITSNPNGRIYSACAERLFYRIPRLGHVPGTVSSATLMLMIMLLGVKLGRWNGNLSAQQEAQILRELSDAASLAGRVIESCGETVREAVEANKNLTKFYFLAAGPNYGMAEFACAKLFEGCAIDGIAQQTEEFAHEQYFVANMHPDNCVVLLAPAGRAVQRAREILSQINFLGLYSVFVTTAPADDVVADKVVVIPGEIDEFLSPLVTLPVVSLFAYHYSMCHDGAVIHFASEAQEPNHRNAVHYSRFHEEVRDMDVPLPPDAQAL